MSRTLDSADTPSCNNICHVGLSKKAGIQGVAQSAVTRCLLVPVACLCFPPMIMSGLKTARLAPSNSRLLLLLELSIIYASLQAALPAALAVFPQVRKRCTYYITRHPSLPLSPFHSLLHDYN